MTTDLFTQLIEAATAQDKLELQLVHNGRVEAMRFYQKSAGKETKANWDAARQAYDEAIERFTARYFPEQAQPPAGERLKNRKQALSWLRDQGHKVSQGKFYQDCDAGFPQVNRDGTVSRWQVMQYGQSLGKDRTTSPGLLPDLAEAEAKKIISDARKAEAQANIEEMKAATMRHEQDRDWLHQDDAWAALAATVGLIKDALRHHFHKASGELIHLAGGDLARGPEIYELTEDIINRALNDLSTNGRLEGVFTEEEDNGAHPQ